jgi:hypothetical protein
MPVKIALVILEVPRRVGAAGADDELAAIERRAQHALGCGLRGRLLGVERCARGEHGAGGGAKAEQIAALHEAVHGSSSFQRSADRRAARHYTAPDHDRQ